MSLVFETRVSKVRGKSRLLPIGSRQIGTSFDDFVREPASRGTKGGPVGAPDPAASATRTALIETATVIARGFAGQPMKRSGKCAGIAEADLKCNRRDRLFAIRQ